MVGMPGFDLYEDMLNAYRITGVIKGKDLQRLKEIDKHYYTELMEYVEAHAPYKERERESALWPQRSDPPTLQQKIDEMGSGRGHTMRVVREQTRELSSKTTGAKSTAFAAIMNQSGDKDCTELYEAYINLVSNDELGDAVRVFELMLECVCEANISRQFTAKGAERVTAPPVHEKARIQHFESALERALRE